MFSINVKIKPGSFKDEIVIDETGQWIIKIREKPIDGAANEYLVKFLAKELDLNKSCVIIEKGLSSRFKKIVLNMPALAYENAVNKYKK